MMPPLEFDPKISIEGISTALGVILALISGMLGFLFGHFRTARAKSKERREKADRLTVMEILERDLFGGLTEEQIKEAFCSDETIMFRQKAGASKPSKLTDHDFARYLRDLQWSHMIDQVEKNKYRMRSAALSYEQDRAKRREVASVITAQIPLNSIFSAIENNFERLDEFEKHRVLGDLVALGHNDIIIRLSNELNSDNPDISLSAARNLLSAIARD